MTMDLDELKQAWSQLQERVDRLELARVSRRSDDALRTTRRRVAAAMALWVVLVVSSATFWSAHLDVPHLVVAGMSLHVYGIIAIVLGAFQLRASARLDDGAPIVTQQRRLAELIRFRLRCSLVLGLPWWFLWVPCMLCGITALTGIDPYDPGWVWSSLAIGVAGIVLTIAIARRIAARTPPSHGLRRMIDDLAGRSLVRAAWELDEVARFIREA